MTRYFLFPYCFFVFSAILIIVLLFGTITPLLNSNFQIETSLEDYFFIPIDNSQFVWPTPRLFYYYFLLWL